MTAPPCLLRVVLILLLIGGGSAAAEPDGLPAAGGVPAGVRVLEDPDRRLTPADVMALPPERWRALDGPALSPGESTSAWWLRFTLTNTEGATQRRILELGWPLLDWLDLYVFADGRILETVLTGDRRPFASRPLDTRTVAVRLELPAGATRELLLRMAMHNGLFAPVSLGLWAPERFWSRVQRDNLWAGLYFGLLTALMLYNLLLSLATRDRSFFYYALYLLSLLLWNVGFIGYGFQFLWPNGIWWQNEPYIWRDFMVDLTSAIFVMHFMQTRQRMPILRGALLFLLGLIGITQAIEVVGWLGVAVPMAKTLRLYVALLALLFPAYLVIGVRGLWLGMPEARYFVLAWSFPVLGQLLFVVQDLADMVRQGPLADHTVEIGTALECLLLALALGDRYRRLRDDKLALERRLREEQDIYTAQLEQQVAERTSALSAAVMQLDTALAAERRAQEEQQAFLASVSHEMRTPLTVIDMTMQNLARSAAKQADDRTQRRFARVLEASRRLSGLLSGHLNEERFSLSSHRLHPKPCAAGELLRDAADAASLIARGHRLRVEHGDVTAPIVCDPDLTRLVLRTLADNAMKYTPPGTEVTLRASPAPAGVWLEVADQGLGVAPDEVERIFEPHFRGQASSGVWGSGMGLALARRMIERQGGALTLVSPPGQGCRFRIWLPNPEPREMND